MAVSTRLLPSFRQLQLYPASSYSSSVSTSNAIISFRRTAKIAWERRISRNGSEDQVAVKVRTSVVSEAAVSDRRQMNVLDLKKSVADVADAALRIFTTKEKREAWRAQTEMFVERGIINCRFFSLIAVAGSLLGSILCFVEGCFLILESFFEYFQTMSQRSQQGEVVQLLIEALDSFLIGTAMLMFGIGIYVSFVGLKEMKRDKELLNPKSNFFGFFPLKRVPSWMEMKSVSQAKSKMGHAVVMLLQAGVVEKFKDVPMSSGLDLACFAGAILFSSACIFLLSRLSIKGKEM